MEQPELDARTGRFRDPATGKFLPGRAVQLRIVPPPAPEVPRFGTWPADAEEPDAVPRLPWRQRLAVRLGRVVRVRP